MGSMIGSGIFIVSADVARQVQSPGLLILAWMLTASMTVIGALSYGELAAAKPRAGGQYVYLREALGPLFGFLYGWTMFLVIPTGTIAAVVVGWSGYVNSFLQDWGIRFPPQLTAAPGTELVSTTAAGSGWAPFRECWRGRPSPGPSQLRAGLPPPRHRVV